MAEYDSSVDLAARLIIKKGRLIKHERLVTDPILPNENKPWNPAKPLPRFQDVKAVIFPINRKLVNGTTILASDQTMLMYAKDLKFPPFVGDNIIDGKKKFKVQFVEELAPGDQTVMYTCQLRTS